MWVAPPGLFFIFKSGGGGLRANEDATDGETVFLERRRRSLLSGQQVEHLPEGQAHLLCARGRRHGDTLRRAQ